MRGRFVFVAGTGAPGERNTWSASGGLMRKYYLLVSDFDQTLSFNDSGLVLAEMLGIPDFQERVASLSRLNLVQSGAELTYLLRHDPDFRGVKEQHLVEVGRRIRLKRNIALLADFLKDGIDGFSFDFYVVSAAPWLVVNSALQGLVPPDHIIGAHFGFNEETGEIENMMNRMTAYYDDEMVRGLETIGKLVEPVVLCGMGSIVAFLLLAAFQPIYQLAASF
jgi:2-hydroxy-3-keto-5-methylthiopentenyl-1-phosphate phosphatase